MAKLEKVIKIIEAVCTEHQIGQVSMLNFVLADGDTLISTRFIVDVQNKGSSPASLYFATGTRFERTNSKLTGPQPFVGGNESLGALLNPLTDVHHHKDLGLEYRMVHSERQNKVCIVTSEPLTEVSTDWVPVPKNHMLVVTKDLKLILVPTASGKCELSSQLSLSPVLSSGQNWASSEGDSADTTAVGARASVALSEDLDVARVMWKRTDSFDVLDQQALLPGVEGTLRSQFPVDKISPICFLKGHSETILSLFVPGERNSSQLHSHLPLLFSGSQDGSLKAWHVQFPLAECIVSTIAHPRGVLKVIGIGPTSTHRSRENTCYYLCTAGADSCIKYWALVRVSDRVWEFDCLHSIQLHGEGQVLSLASSMPLPDFARGDLVLFSGLQSTRILKHTIRGSDTSSCDGSHRPDIIISEMSPMSSKCIFERHYGFVNVLLVLEKEGCVVSGGGDGLIRIWKYRAETSQVQSPCVVKTLRGHSGEVLSLAAQEGLLISGSRDCSIKVWDLETLSCRRTLRAHCEAILSLCLTANSLFSASSDGEVFIWSREGGFTPTTRLDLAVSSGPRLSSMSLSVGPNDATDGGQRLFIFTGWSDAVIRVFRCACRLFLYSLCRGVCVPSLCYVACSVENTGSAMNRTDSWSSTTARRRSAPSKPADDDADLSVGSFSGAASPTELSPPNVAKRDTPEQLAIRTIREIGRMEQSRWEDYGLQCLLSALVSFRSISLEPRFLDECWQCAKFLGQCFELMCGATVRLVTPAVHEESRPVILARVGSDPTKPTLVVYGHYDVQPAGNLADWDSDPWKLTGLNGYIKKLKYVIWLEI